MATQVLGKDMSDFIQTPGGILIPVPKAEPPPSPKAVAAADATAPDWSDEVEPRIWSHITDDHPDCGVAHCRRCKGMVQCSENMVPWVETGIGPFCFDCFKVVAAQWDNDFDGFRIPGPRHPEHKRYAEKLARDEWPEWKDGVDYEERTSGLFEERGDSSVIPGSGVITPQDVLDDVRSIGYGCGNPAFEFAKAVNDAAASIGVEPKLIHDKMREERRKRWVKGELTQAERDFYGDNFEMEVVDRAAASNTVAQFFREAKICGCGQPTDFIDWLTKLLRAIADSFDDKADNGKMLTKEEYETQPKRLLTKAAHDGLHWLAWYWLDATGLTEHGGNASNGWLTYKGNDLLAALELLGVDGAYEAIK